MSDYQKNRPESIQAMFGSIASQYDRANAILSFQLHKVWNKRLVDSILSENNEFPVADLCCGTGEIGLTYLRKAKKESSLILIDFCQEMLDCARYKAEKLPLSHHSLQYIQADVQNIPLENEAVGAVSIAYGIRNVQDPRKCIKEVNRILMPNGKLGILELTQPTNVLLKMGHLFYLKALLPLLGKAITSNEEAYRYLCNSIQAFVKPKELEQILQEEGFRNILITPLHGGIATLITANHK